MNGCAGRLYTFCSCYRVSFLANCHCCRLPVLPRILTHPFAAYTPESGPYHVARGAVGFREGTAKFVFRVIKDLEHNEGVLFGASRKVISTPDFQGPNNDMWLYRAFSGNLYDCGKEIETKLEKFTTGDRVTVEIDFDEDQIAFRKNDGPRTKVFTGIVGEELFPVVAFYYNLKSEVALESVSGDALPPKAAI
eukprot:m.457753 g.457753  ORF g.457753 m.457753 type:complete len:193 (+) comp20335_c1_seq2:50-628(+)